jgi:hypothetical protein
MPEYQADSMPIRCSDHRLQTFNVVLVVEATSVQGETRKIRLLRKSFALPPVPVLVAGLPPLAANPTLAPIVPFSGRSKDFSESFCNCF